MRDENASYCYCYLFHNITSCTSLTNWRHEMRSFRQSVQQKQYTQTIQYRNTTSIQRTPKTDSDSKNRLNLTESSKTKPANNIDSESHPHISTKVPSSSCSRIPKSAHNSQRNRRIRNNPIMSCNLKHQYTEFLPSFPIKNQEKRRTHHQTPESELPLWVSQLPSKSSHPRNQKVQSC